MAVELAAEILEDTDTRKWAHDFGMEDVWRFSLSSPLSLQSTILYTARGVYVASWYCQGDQEHLRELKFKGKRNLALHSQYLGPLIEKR